MFGTLIDLIEERKQVDKGITFINSGTEEKHVTYQELYDTACSYLYNLQKEGLEAGDELIFQIDDNETFIKVFWACILGGIRPVPVAVGTNEEHNLKLIKIMKVLTNPYVILTEQRRHTLTNMLEEESLLNKEKFIMLDNVTHITFEKGHIHQAKPSEIAFIQFSSGSTSDPKGVTLTHENLIRNTISLMKGLDTKDTDSIIGWMPLTHDMGLIGNHLYPIMGNINQFSMPTMLFIRRPVLWIQKACEHKVTILTATNFSYRFILNVFKPENNKELDLSHVKCIVTGAEPISADLESTFVDVFKPFGLNEGAIFNVYGLAEATLGVTMPDIGAGINYVNADRHNLNLGDSLSSVSEGDIKGFKLVKLGVPLIDCAVRICNEEDKEVKENVIGHIQINGGGVTGGYYNNKSVTSDSKTKDGWFRTGDVGTISDGNLIVTGRSKEMIIINGQNFYPHDIEETISLDKAIASLKVAACGVKVSGEEQVAIFVTFRKPIEKFLPLIKQIKTKVNRAIGVPVSYVVPISQIPSTTSGKIQRTLLSRRFCQGEFDQILADIQTIEKLKEVDIQDRIVDICKEVSGLENIGLDENFTSMGMNSLLLTNIYDKMKQEFGDVEFRLADMFAYPTIRKFSSYLEGKGSIDLDGVVFPSEYFNKDTNRKTQEYEVTFDRENLQVLKQVSIQEGTRINDVILSFLVHQLSNISKGNPTLHALLEAEDIITPLFIQLEEVSDLSMLIQQIKEASHSISSPFVYETSHLTQSNVTKHLDQISILFASSHLVKNEEALAFYELYFELTEQEDALKIHIVFQNRNWNQELTDLFVEEFMRLISVLFSKASQG
ncbi:non-ribosomal peptide synthetase [Fictibacillus nanhaiensis]|uniref:non-ribosomal peptide synthetase n=1 Tax=Fictibacillus nanhaiensis TaxID=742169 RepID=UPI003C2A99C6